MDLKDVIEKQLKEIIESGVIENKIKETLTKSIESIIVDSLKDWSDFGKGLKEKLSKSFNLDLSRLTIPEYGSMMLSYIKDEIDLHMKNETNKTLKKSISNFFKPLEKDEYNLSDIVDGFKEMVKNENMNSQDILEESIEITCIVKGDGSAYVDLYLDEGENKEKYQCDWHIRINENGIWHIQTPYGELHKTRNTILSPFERLLFQMYSQKIKINNDSDKIETYISSDID